MKITSSKRWTILAGLLFLAALPAAAQESLVSVSVEPKGAPFQVDGTLFYAPASFTWPKGSKHILEIMNYCASSPTIPIPDVCQTRYTAKSWTTNRGDISTPSAMAVVTADPAITWVKGSAIVEHRIRLSFFDAPGLSDVPFPFPSSRCLGPKPSTGAPGIACAGGQCYQHSTELWLPPGTIQLEAIPYDGFVFSAWYTGSTGQPFVGSYTVTGPTVLQARFEPAKRVQIITDPPSLRVLVDRAEIVTSDPQNYVPTCSAPGYFDFAEGSTHVLGAPTPQVDLYSKEWVFDSFSIGGGQNTVYKADQANVPAVIVAKFLPSVHVTFGVPKGLKLIVDGRDTWPSYNFAWGAGTKHVVTAPPEQTDQNGRKYVFKRWSNGGSATQEITADGTGFYLTAEYSVLGLVNIQSNVQGVKVQIGNETCVIPCTVNREAGSELLITAPQQVPLSDTSRLELVSFNGDTSGVQNVKFTSDAVALVANYRTTFKVSAISVPANGADFRIEPASADAFYPANTRIQVFATSRPGFRFKRWDGDAAGQFSPASFTVTGALSMRALLDVVPTISPAGVRNAAGETSVTGVAPGSIVSIYGSSLAPNVEIGPASPLVQSLAGVTVQVSGRILPLFFVSPEQINAQLPYDLPLGTQTVIVKNRNLPDVSADFEVVRNAPGIFASLQGGLTVAAVTRSEGPAVTAEHPVQGGELISVFGTGFGPHRVSPPEGFGVPEGDTFRLADPVQIVIGNQVIVPEYAGVAAGMPGAVVLRFRTPADLSIESISQLSVRVNDVATSMAVLPTSKLFASPDQSAQ